MRKKAAISAVLRFLYLTSCYFFLVSSSSFSQQVFTGKVLNKRGVTLSGATVSVRGTNKTTISDSLGSFALDAKSGDIIDVSFIGYRSVEIKLQEQTTMTVTLEETITVLDDIVVIGYGTSKRKDLTGAIGSVSEKDFNKGVFASPDLLVQGKISGLQITYNNGQPGGAANIKIRGNSALSSTGQPLFVIDGVPLDGRSSQDGNNPLNFINPDDVASIDVLKDASATAIYGSRAAYGVMIINTKKAQTGLPKVDFGISVGVSSILKKIDVLNAAQYREAIPYYNVNPLHDHGADVDTYDVILQNGFQSNYTIAITGGNENGKYRLSGNILDQDGIIKNTGFEKYAIGLSTNFKFLESRKLGADVNVLSSQYLQDVPPPENGYGGLLFSTLKWNPTDSLKHADGSFTNVPGIHNPAAFVEMVNNNLKVTTILGSVSPYYKFTSWLEYKLLFSINYSTSVSRTWFHQDILLNPPGTARVSNSELTTKQITHTLHFDKEIFSDLKLDAIAGFEYTQFKFKGFSASGNGVPGTGFGNFGLDYTNYIQYSDLNGRSILSFADPTSELQSFFGRTIFSYKEKYLLTATLRADGSSKFGENNKYGYFPSFAAAWNISKEKFFKFDFFNSLKIRGGWGITGNQDFPAGSAQARYSFFDNGNLRQANNPNPDLKWQSDHQYNIGLDFSIFKNRISGTIDYFNKKTTNLLFPSPPIQPAPLDATVNWMNLDGEIKNNGIEILVNGLIIDSEPFKFDLSINATFLKNNVSGLQATVSTGYAVSGPVQVIENGFPKNSFYTRKFLGIDKTTGFSIYEDNGNFFHLGNPNPNVLLGINPSFRYKKLSLTASMYGAFGQDIFFQPLMNALNVGGINTGSNIGLTEFQNPVRESVNNPSQSPSSRFIFKGNYLKMSNLTLSYSVGNVKKVFKGVRLTLTGQNLFIITKYPGFDPEANGNASIKGIPSLGIDVLQYPSSRTIIFGLNLTL